MGCYVNPPNEGKEAFLQREGTYAPPDKRWPDDPQTTALVCLVDNGHFTAAGIAYDEREMEAFDGPDDPRIKFWFHVPWDKIWGNMHASERKRLKERLAEIYGDKAPCSTTA